MMVKSGMNEGIRATPPPIPHPRCHAYTARVRKAETRIETTNTAN